MRVLFCNIHCPSFICFCKPSSHIYTAGPLKLENSPHVPSTTVVSLGSDASNIDHDHVSGGESETIEVKEKSVDGNNKQQPQQQEEKAGENHLKSSIKKPSSNLKEVKKKSVQWMDFLGKELVEIREFEASESEDNDNEVDVHGGCVHRGCCNIL